MLREESCSLKNCLRRDLKGVSSNETKIARCFEVDVWNTVWCIKRRVLTPNGRHYRMCAHVFLEIWWPTIQLPVHIVIMLENSKILLINRCRVEVVITDLISEHAFCQSRDANAGLYWRHSIVFTHPSKDLQRQVVTA